MRLNAVRRAPAPPAEIRVVKLGSSAVEGPGDIARVVDVELSPAVARGEKIVAVVSAWRGETDRRQAFAESLGRGRRSPYAAHFISLGESEAAYALAIACAAAGLDAAVLDIETLALRAEGPETDAAPCDVDAARIHDALAANDVVVVPGFCGLGADGRRVLLGRGGTDLTAVFLAASLGLPHATLVKDVDGVYDRDPALFADACRLDALSWADAERVAGRLVQTRAIRFAADRGVGIIVRKAGGEAATIIGRPAP